MRAAKVKYDATHGRLETGEHPPCILDLQEPFRTLSLTHLLTNPLTYSVTKSLIHSLYT